MRRLGLDIGTNSIGWCLTEDDQKIVDIGVRIFADGRDPKSGASLAVDRRVARGMRRRRDRYLGRRSAFLDALVTHGLMPADADDAKLVAQRDPYELRAKALDEKLQPYEIGRALFHLNQRRGFKSNRKAERKTGEDGKIAGGAKALDAAMAEAGARTLGEFLSLRLKKGETARVRMGGESQSYDFYPQRDHVLDEFKIIWKAQAGRHPALLNDTVYAALYRIIEFQRPLREQEVGVCTFVHSERRLPKAHPLFQERRLYEEVNQLEITTPGEANRKLNMDERDLLVRRLKLSKAVAFESLGKLLKLEPEQSFNKASETRTQLAGDEVNATMSDKKRFGEKWAHLDRDRQWVIVERLMEEENPDALHAFLTEDCGLDDDHAAATAKASLPELYGRLGPIATRRILDELKKEVITYDKAVERCGWHHSDERTGEILPQLPYYGELLTRDIPPGTQHPDDPPEKRWGKITNPTVHIGLRQLEKLVNAVIKVHGRPDQIVVELARDLKLNEEQKKQHNDRIRETTAAAKRRSTKLIEMGQRDTGANRMLLRMWEELNPGNPLDRRCPYCGRMINAEALFNGSADVDHILPYSRTLDDSPGNKILAHRNCNRIKGNDTPFGRWGHTETWLIITEQVSRLHKSKQKRFSPTALEDFEKNRDFLDRQLVDTQFLSKIARNYLSSLYPESGEGSARVYVIPGQMTAMLRRLWGLNELLPDHNYPAVENKHSNAPKNRLDHRHHAIDAAVVAVTTRARLNEIAKAAGRAERQELHKMFDGLPEPWTDFRDELREKLVAVTVSHKPDHGQRGRSAPGRDVTSGKLHDETAYGLTGEYGPDGKTPVVVKRIAFSSLEAKDISDPERIRDATLRSELYRATEGFSGVAFQQALARFAREHPVFHGIRHVRVLGERAGTPTLNVIPIKDREGRAYKAYKGNANARFQIWRLPNGNWVSQTVSMFVAHQPRNEPPRPHPAAKKIMDLRQNDLLAVERNGGGREIVRVVKFSESGQVTLAAHNEGGALKARDNASNEIDPFKYVAPTAGGLKKIKARQVRIDPLGRIFDPGPR